MRRSRFGRRRMVRSSFAAVLATIGGESSTADDDDLDHGLYTQYFSRRFDALHYAYWHHNFGHPMSRGCVNMRLQDSRLAWESGTFGTLVEVHD